MQYFPPNRNQNVDLAVNLRALFFAIETAACLSAAPALVDALAALPAHMLLPAGALPVRHCDTLQWPEDCSKEQQAVLQASVTFLTGTLQLHGVLVTPAAPQPSGAPRPSAALEAALLAISTRAATLDSIAAESKHQHDQADPTMQILCAMLLTTKLLVLLHSGCCTVLKDQTSQPLQDILTSLVGMFSEDLPWRNGCPTPHKQLAVQHVVHSLVQLITPQYMQPGAHTSNSYIFKLIEAILEALLMTPSPKWIAVGALVAICNAGTTLNQCMLMYSTCAC